ncbi:MAG: hypothetical protein KGL35_03155 [Bradyrhizobium sp.]|nr:hypothetical protein [Bradyrhizobium sp.]
MVRRLIVPLTAALVAVYAGPSLAQGAFPAPLPGHAAVPANDPAFPPVRGAAPANDPAFPPVNGAAPASDPAFPPVNGSAPATMGRPMQSSFPVNGAAPLVGAGFSAAPAPPTQGGGDNCMKDFLPLRGEAEKRGKLLKAASDRHASPEEACKLFKSFSVAESKMLSYVETHSAKCGIPPQVTDQLKGNHKNTETMLQKVCAAAQQAQMRGPAGPSLSEVLGSAATLPEATPTKKGGSTFDTLNGNVLSR